MPKQIVLKVPEWVNERELKNLVENYIEAKLPDSASREEYIEFLKINPEEIVEYPIDKEIKNLKELRKKAKERCLF
ncbi:MAG: hypothetical protein GXO66_07680 [Euryarchaeota archaeon]|nr:hypothetical protein [Euryarchaeota archaeon]